MALVAENISGHLLAKLATLPADLCPLVAFRLCIANRSRQRAVPVFDNAAAQLRLERAQDREHPEICIPKNPADPQASGEASWTWCRHQPGAQVAIQLKERAVDHLLHSWVAHLNAAFPQLSPCRLVLRPQPGKILRTAFGFSVRKGRLFRLRSYQRERRPSSLMSLGCAGPGVLRPSEIYFAN